LASIFPELSKDNGSREGKAMKKAPTKTCKCLILIVGVGKIKTGYLTG
jgi:hypothetical protein